jgi:Fe-S-cluster containining protein
MTVTEAIALGDVFVPSLLYKLARAPRPDNEVGWRDVFVEPEFAEMDKKEYVGAIIAYVSRTGVHIGTQPGWDLYLTITSRPWIYPRVERCPALAADGKLCTIHTRRPGTCRTVPVGYDVPDALVVPAFRGLVERGKSARGWECDTSNAAPVLLRNGQVVDAEYARARAEGVERAEKEKELTERLLRSPMLPPLAEIVRAMGQQASLSASFFGAAVEAKNMGLIDEERLKTFCDQQIGHLERETEAALKRRDKSEREWTNRFRSLLDAYRTIRKGIA